MLHSRRELALPVDLSSIGVVTLSVLLLQAGFLFRVTRGLSMIDSNAINADVKGISRNNKVLLTGLQNALNGNALDPLSPQGSWFLFNQNDALQKTKKRKSRRRKCKRCQKDIPIPKEVPIGPQGPRGPQGPQGQPGGLLSLKEIESYISVYLADMLSKNESIDTDIVTKNRYKASFKSDIPVVFTAQLHHKEAVPPLKAAVVKGLTVTFGPGQFKRGVIVRSGRFTVLRSGVYQVSGTIPIQRKKMLEKPNDEEKSVSVYLCVDSCITDRRIRWSSSFDSRSKTAVISGYVRLKRGQSLMILISNPTRSELEALSGSTLSAALIGT